MKKRPEHEEHKPSEHSRQPGKQKARGRPRQVSSFSRIGGAALATALVLSHAPSAEARQSIWGMQGPKPPHAADTDKPVREGVTTTVSVSRGDGGAFFVVSYKNDNGIESSVRLPFEGENPAIRFVIPGREISVILTDDAAYLTLGSAAAARGERHILLDGRPTLGNFLRFALPSDCLDAEGGGISSAEVVEGDAGPVLYFSNISGKVRSTRLNIRDDPYSIAELGMSTPLLVKAGSGVIAYEPGNRRVAFLKWTEDEEMVKAEAMLPSPPSSPPIVEASGPEVRAYFGSTQVIFTRTASGDYVAVLATE